MIDIDKIVKFSEEQGWKITMIDDEQCLTRIQRDEFIIDIWSGKKGTTVGVRHEKTSRYFKRINKFYLKELIVDPDVLAKEKKGRLYKYNRLVKEK